MKRAARVRRGGRPKSQVIYRAQPFKAAIDRLFGSGAASAVDALLQAAAVPRAPEHSEPIVAQEAALILAAVAARGCHREIHADVARSILRMDYQFEYGPNGTSDRKGLRAASAPPEKDYFGAQLASEFLEFWSARPTKQTSATAVTIGQTREGDCIGLLHYPGRGKTLVYSDAHLIRNTQPGIVRFTTMEFDFVRMFDVAPATWRSFARLISQNKVGGGGPETSVGPEAFDG